MSHHESQSNVGYRIRRKRSERASKRDQLDAALTAVKIWLRRKEAHNVMRKIIKEYETHEKL